MLFASRSALVHTTWPRSVRTKCESGVIYHHYGMSRFIQLHSNISEIVYFKSGVKHYKKHVLTNAHIIVWPFEIHHASKTKRNGGLWLVAACLCVVFDCARYVIHVRVRAMYAHFGFVCEEDCLPDKLLHCGGCRNRVWCSLIACLCYAGRVREMNQHHFLKQLLRVLKVAGLYMITAVGVWLDDLSALNKALFWPSQNTASLKPVFKNFALAIHASSKVTTGELGSKPLFREMELQLLTKYKGPQARCCWLTCYCETQTTTAVGFLVGASNPELLLALDCTTFSELMLSFRGAACWLVVGETTVEFK